MAHTPDFQSEVTFSGLTVSGDGRILRDGNYKKESKLKYIKRCLSFRLWQIRYRLGLL